MSPAGRTRRRSRGRRKKQKNTGRIVFCTFVEVIVIAALVIMIGWDKGVGAWLLKFSQPVVKELDISGIQSPYAVLMQANSGKILGSQGAEERIYPASMTKMMTAILAIEEIKDLDQEIALTQEMFAGLMSRMPHRRDFSRERMCGQLIWYMECCCHQVRSAALPWQIIFPVLRKLL